MCISPQSRRLPAMLGLIAFGLVALALILATSAAAAAPKRVPSRPTIAAPNPS